jgi:hypothetical protein
MHQRRARGSALFAAALLAAVTGCGTTSAPAGTRTDAQVVPEMKAAAQAATSVRMTGTGRVGSTTVTFDLSFIGSSEISGSFTEGGQSLAIEAVAGETYIKINQGFLVIAKLPATDCASICGKYVELPAAEASQIDGSITLRSLSKQIFGAIPASASSDTSVDFVHSTYHGQPVLTAHGAGYTLDVAATGSPYPLFIANSQGDDVTFSEWNSVPALTPPPASEVITI